MYKHTLIFIALTLIGITLLLKPRIDKKTLKNIKKYEGLRLKPYKDLGGKWTVGWGHLIILPKEKYLLNKTISLKKANALFNSDVAKTGKALDKLIKIKINNNQYNALLSLVFNIGVGNFAKSTMLKLLNSKKINQAGNEFLRWHYVQKIPNAGLLTRRADEQKTFFT